MDRVRKKGVFWKKGSFQKTPLSRDSRELEILEFLENPQTVEKKGDSDPRDSREFRDFRGSRDFSRNDPFFQSRMEKRAESRKLETKKIPVPQTGISPEFRATWVSRRKKKRPFPAFSFLFSCVFGAKKGKKKICAQPWYARKSGYSLAPVPVLKGKNAAKI